MNGEDDFWEMKGFVEVTKGMQKAIMPQKYDLRP